MSNQNDFRYVFVGSVATAIFYALANVCKLFCPALLATFLGNLVSFIFGYLAQMRFTFQTNTKHKTMLPRYIALLLIIFLYGQIITHLGEFYNFSYYFTSGIIALSVPLFSYPLQKFWVFGKFYKA